MEMIRHLAGNSMLVKKEEHLGRQIDLEKKMNEYNGEVYTIDQIGKLAVKYHLRFLSSTLFKGDLDINTIIKLKEFAKDTNTGIDEWTLKSKFFILAPAESFNMNVKTISEIKRAEQIAKDPVLFYKIDDIHYRMIRGSDFNVLQLIKGWVYKNEKNYLWFTWISSLLFCAITMFIANKFLISCNVNWIKSNCGHYHSRFWSYFVLNISVLILPIINLYKKIDRMPSMDYSRSERNLMFGITNWDSPNFIDLKN